MPTGKYRCLTCAALNDGTDRFAVKLRSDEGEVIDGTSSKELTPDEYYGKEGIKVIQSTQTPRPKAAKEGEQAETVDESDESADDISTDNFQKYETKENPDKETTKKAPVKKAATKTASKKASKKK